MLGAATKVWLPPAAMEPDWLPALKVRAGTDTLNLPPGLAEPLIVAVIQK